MKQGPKSYVLSSKDNSTIGSNPLPFRDIGKVGPFLICYKILKTIVWFISFTFSTSSVPLSSSFVGGQNINSDMVLWLGSAFPSSGRMLIMGESAGDLVVNTPLVSTSSHAYSKLYLPVLIRLICLRHFSCTST